MRPNKVQHVRERILREIRIGNYPRGSLLPPERIMADEFGVSYMTLRKAVGALVDENYLERAHSIGTFVRSKIPEHKVQKQLGAVLPAWAAPEYLDFSMYITEATEKANWLVKTVHARNWEDRAISDLYQNSDAMFCLTIRDLWMIPEALMKTFRSREKPVVFFGTVDGTESVDAVIDTPELGLAELARDLYHRGYRRVLQVEQQVFSGKISRFINPGMHRIGEYLSSRYPDVEFDSGSLLFEVPRFELPHKVIGDKIRELGKDCFKDALIVTPLSYYWGIVRGLCESGLNIPKDVSILCYGDRQESYYYWPRPAIYCPRTREIAFRAMELIRWREQNPNSPHRVERVAAVFLPGETLRN